MAPVVPHPKKIRSFPTQAAFEAWLSSHHAGETELWLKIHKKDSGLPTVTYAEAVGSSRVDLQACKLEYSIVSPK